MQTGQPTQTPAERISYIAYTCENPACRQQFKYNTRAVPLHCPFCGGPLSIVGMGIAGLKDIHTGLPIIIKEG
jgi:hypothetical protein